MRAEDRLYGSSCGAERAEVTRDLGEAGVQMVLGEQAWVVHDESGVVY